MLRSLLTWLLVTAGAVLAFRMNTAGTPLFWAFVAAPYLLLLPLALYKLWDEGSLVDFLQPKRGDITLGTLTAVLILAASWAVRSVLAPVGTLRHAWYFRIYLQIGDPEALQHSLSYTLVVLSLALAEEVVWRGMVLSELTERFGRRAWPFAALLYALSTLPTLFLLRDPLAGPNPLLFLAALGSGIVWSFVTAQTKRVGPVAVSHMAFVYFSIAQFRWQGF